MMNVIGSGCIPVQELPVAVCHVVVAEGNETSILRGLRVSGRRSSLPRHRRNADTPNRNGCHGQACESIGHDYPPRAVDGRNSSYGKCTRSRAIRELTRRGSLRSSQLRTNDLCPSTRQGAFVKGGLQIYSRARVCSYGIP